MAFNKKKFNYYRHEDLNGIDELLKEAQKGIKNSKRTWKDVSPSLKQNIEKGFPAIVGLTVAGVAFTATLKETKNLIKAAIAAIFTLFVLLAGFFFGKKRQDGITELELAKYNEVIKHQSLIIKEQDSKLKQQTKRVNVLLKVLKKRENESESSLREEYLTKMENSLSKVASKLEQDLVLEGVDL